MDKKIHLILFSVQQMLFGIYAEQVEELLDQEDVSIEDIKTPEFTLRYQSQQIRGIHFSAWLQCKESSTGVAEKKCHRQQPRKSLPRSAPPILIIKYQGSGYLGVQIEKLEELMTVSLDQIHALPVFMQKTRRIKGIWGIASVENRTIILLDPTQF